MFFNVKLVQYFMGRIYAGFIGDTKLIILPVDLLLRIFINRYWRNQYPMGMFKFFNSCKKWNTVWFKAIGWVNCWNSRRWVPRCINYEIIIICSWFNFSWADYFNIKNFFFDIALKMLCPTKPLPMTKILLLIYFNLR